MRKWLQILVCLSITIAVLISFFLFKQQLISGKSQKQFTALRLGTTYGEEHPNAQAVRIFADLVHKQSNGQLALELFYDRKLGDAPQLLEQLVFGGVALAMVDSVTLSQQIPQLSELLQITPGLDPAQAQRELVERWDTISELLQQEQLDVLAIYMPDYRVIATAVHPIQMPQDFAGLRLYQPNQLALQNGAQRVQVRWEDLPQSIANNFADGAEMTLLEYSDADYQPVMPYLAVQREMYRVDFLLVSEVSMGLLNPETQRLIRNVALETLKPQEELLLAAQRQAVQALSQQLVQVYPLQLLEADVLEWATVLADDPWLWKGESE